MRKIPLKWGSNVLHNVEQIEISHVKLTQILSESRKNNIITIDVPTTRRIKQKQKQLGLGIVHRLRKKKKRGNHKGDTNVTPTLFRTRRRAIAAVCNTYYNCRPISN